MIQTHIISKLAFTVKHRGKSRVYKKKKETKIKEAIKQCHKI